VLSAAVLFLPRSVMGATISHLFIGARHCRRGYRRSARSQYVGRIPGARAVRRHPAARSRDKAALGLLSLAYLSLLPSADRQTAWSLTGVAALLGFASLGSLQHVEPPPGGRSIEVRNGVMGDGGRRERLAGKPLLEGQQSLRDGRDRIRLPGPAPPAAPHASAPCPWTSPGYWVWERA
jgi:hypothetical protein